MPEQLTILQKLNEQATETATAYEKFAPLRRCSMLFMYAFSSYQYFHF